MGRKKTDCISEDIVPSYRYVSKRIRLLLIACLIAFSTFVKGDFPVLISKKITSISSILIFSSLSRYFSMLRKTIKSIGLPRKVQSAGE